MNYFFDFNPITQVPDSTQSSSSFMQQNEQGFMGQQSMMSSGFSNNSIDSLVQSKTSRRRTRKKKVIKSYKYIDSYLIVEKDQFPFLENIKSKDFTPINFDNFIAESDISTPVYKIFNPADTINTSISTEEVMEIKQDTSFVIQNKVEEIIVLSEPEVKLVTIEETPEPSKEITTDNVVSLSSEIWLMGVLLAILLLFALIKLQFNSKLKLYSQSLISYQLFNKMFKEQNSINLQLGLLLSILFYANTSLIIYYSLLYDSSTSHLSEYGFWPFVIIFGLLFLIFFFFTIINKTISLIFESYELINEYLYNVYFFHRLLGLTLLPVAVLYPYLPPIAGQVSIYLAWLIILISFILRWLRGTKISFKHRVPYFYMILYLCILEIIPLMFITKLILSLY